MDDFQLGSNQLPKIEGFVFMAASLKSQTIQALFWSFIEAVGAQGIRFIIGIILARLLFPDQFGLIGMVTIFMAISQSFVDSGFCAALIQKQNPTQTDISSIFYFNIIIGIAVTGALWLISPWVALFYKQPILTSLIKALSLVVMINSFSLIQSTMLTKKIDFRRQAIISLGSGILSGVIGVILAYKKYGVWSLVVQQISGALFNTILFWIISDWRPVLTFSFCSIKSMFRFGSRLLASGLLNNIFDNIYYIIIGKLFSANELGFYTRAQSIRALPSQTLSAMVCRVTFPVFSVIQNDPARLKKALKKSLTILVFFNFPMMLGLAFTARPLVIIILTNKWANCISYLQLLCILGLLFPLHDINLRILQALGRSDLFFRLEIIKKALAVLNIAITWRYGISIMIYGMIVVSLISYYLNCYYNGKLIGYSIKEQICDLFPYLIAANIMGAAIYLSGLIAFKSSLLMLLFQLCIGVVIYLSLCKICRMDAFSEVWLLGIKKIKYIRSLLSQRCGYHHI